jgi:hypothetical protein
MILNLTQHPATPEQVAAGVVDLEGKNLERLKELLTFDSIEVAKNYRFDRARQLADLVSRIKLGDEDSLNEDGTAIFVMIGGAPYLMAPLENVLMKDNRVPVYAFSVRESVEQIQSDGSVVKSNIFRHGGFVS